MTDSTTTATDLADPTTSIAVIGMAGRFPGARSLAEYWRNLCNGVESIVPLDPQALRTAGIDDDAIDDRRYIRAGAPLDGIDEFDAELFGFTAAAANGLDPQHRLFLQTVWDAVTDAGYDPRNLDGAVGVYGTSSASGYLLNNLMSRLDVNRIIGQGASFEMIDLSLHNDKDHIATRVAHQFDLHGPALSVQTACSSSAVAVHLACQALISGEVDTAIAGGASIRVPNIAGYWHETGAMTSPSGHCRPFDARADGTVFGSGVGAVVLKTLQAAQDDGDPIHAVIRGSAINNDGAAKMTYAAPTAAGQAAAIAEAHAVAGIDPSDIGFVETHGTGTPLGDPIEIEGLRQAFELAAEDRAEPCRLGSVKANIGHLEVASGIAGLIKTILCLENATIPATLHYTAPNPELHLDRGPFEVNNEAVQWHSDRPRRAGVSSFGVGGTNVHIVLEQAPNATAPANTPRPSTGADTGTEAGSLYPLLLSGRGAERLAVARAALAEHLEADPHADLRDVAATLAQRPADVTRGITVVRDVEHAVQVLREGGGAAADLPIGGERSVDRVVLLFPGQGSQYVGMASGLYRSEPVFAEHFDRCAAGFDAALGIDLRSLVFSGRARDLERTDRSQPALFTVEYALARLLEHRGITPSLLVGHSVGEYVAATIAGVFDLPTAIGLVAERGELMQAAPSGTMLAVALSPAELTPRLGDRIDIATINETDGCVVAGPAEAIGEFGAALAADGVTARRVRTSHAFHSRLMESAAARFAEKLSTVDLKPPKIPMASNVTGALMSDAEATDPQMWARQIRATVRFADELATVLAQPHRVLIEVGPGGTLTSAAKRHPRFDETHRVVRLLRHPAQDRDDHEVFIEGLGLLWAAGVGADLAPQGRRVQLPGYPFLPERHWIDPVRGVRRPTAGGELDTQDTDEAPDTEAGAEATLGRVWASCLGVDAVDPRADFFDLGGDSLIAIGVSMAAGHAGIEITPQDLYDHPTVTALAGAVNARDVHGGLSLDHEPTSRPPLPPNLVRLLEHGIADPARWRVPIVLNLRPDLTTDDVRAVLDALIARHEALRLRLSTEGGIAAQEIAAADDPLLRSRVEEETLSAGTDPDEAAGKRLTGIIAAADHTTPPLTAHLIRVPEGPSRLALTLHGSAADARSRDVLLTDLLTAFGSRAAGVDIALAPPPIGWGEWSRRASTLAAHPSVLGSADRWITRPSATVRVAASDPGERPASSDYRRLPTTVGPIVAAELDDARRRTGIRLEELLAAALVRAITAVAGDGTVEIELDGDCRSVLRPKVDLRETAGWFATPHPVAIDPAGHDDRRLVELAREQIRDVPHHGIGYGLLRHLYAPTAARLAAVPEPDVRLNVVGTVPEPPASGQNTAPVWFGADVAMPVRDAVPALGTPVELRVFRVGGRMHLHWWYDHRRVEAERIDALAAAVLTALDGLGARVAAEPDDGADDDWDLVDLSEGSVQ